MSSIKKITPLLTTLFLWIAVSKNEIFGQTTDTPSKLVKISLRNNSILPKNVGLKIIKPNAELETCYIGGWWLLSNKTFEFPVGTRLEFYNKKDVPVVMSGKFDIDANFILEIKNNDEGKIFNLWK